MYVRNSFHKTIQQTNSLASAQRKEFNMFEELRN